MNKFYVKDGSNVYGFGTINEVVVFLEKLLVHKTKITRKQWMENLADLGYGPDEPTGNRFVNSLQERFEIGVFRNQKTIRCNIYEATAFQKPEYGN